MPSPIDPPARPSLPRVLGVRALTASTVNCIVGVGIFVLPGIAARELGPAAIVAYLIAGAAVSLVVLCFAEAGSRVSSTGGLYAYVRTAFGLYAGCLAGALLWFAAGAVAAAGVANILMDALSEVIPALSGGPPRAIVLIALYAALAALNIRGVRAGARMVEGVTIAKLAPLLLLAVVGLFAIHPSNLGWHTMPSGGQLGRTSLLLVFAFAGTEVALTPSGEVRDPARTVPRAVLLGLGVVVLLYLALQIVAQGVLGDRLPQAANAPLAEAAAQVLGRSGRALVLAGAAISAFGYLTSDVLATPRSLYALAEDGLAPAWLGLVHQRYRTPAAAIVVHAAATCAFALTGTFRTLAFLSNLGALLLYLGCCLAVLQLRRKNVATEGTPFRVPGGPAVPLLASLLILWLMLSGTATEFAGVGAMLVVASVGFVVAQAQRRRKASLTRTAAP